MTSAAPAHGAAPPMAYTPDPSASSEAQTVDDTVAGRPARPTLRDQISEHPLLSLVVGFTLALFTFLGTVLAGLLFFTLNDINDGLDSLGERIDRVEVSLGERIDRLEAKVDAGFAAQNARLTAQIAELDARLTAQIAELDARLTAQIAELERKLTALIAHLNATEAVDAALEHRLLIPNASAREPEASDP